MEFKTLQQLCTEIIDCPHTTPEWKTDGIPVIRNYNLQNGFIDKSRLSFVDNDTYLQRIKRGAPQVDDIIFSREAPVGSVAIMPSNFRCCLGQRLVLLKVDKSICDPHYLLYVMLSDFVKKQYKTVEKTGSIVSNFNIGDLKNLVIPYVDIAIQKKIGKMCGVLDRKIAVNNRIIENLESMAKTLYDYWFVQFDFPYDNGHPYKTSGGKMEWNETLSREIPIGWEVVQLKKFAEVIQGNSPAGNTLNLEKNGIAFYQGKTDFGMRFPIERIYTTEPYRYAEPMDTLLSVRAPVGSVNMSEDKCCIGRGLAAIHQEKYPSLVYYMMMRLQPLFEKRGGGGTTFDSITKDDIKDALICRPPKLICELFEKQVSVIDRQILNLTQSARKLSSLRDFLLPVLMNGQVGFLNEREDL